MRHHGPMAMTLQSGDSPGSAPEAPDRSGRLRRRWIVLGVVVALALGAAVYVVRHRPVTPEQFDSFAQRIDAFPAPAARWTAYDPTVTGYGAGADGGWQPRTAATWTNLQDPSWWIAVHGWQVAVPTSDASAACLEVVAWMAATGASLDLPSSESPATQARCEEAVATVVGEAGSSSDAWAGQGVQSTDGGMRYRTGSIMTREESDPGHVTIAVMADASVFRG